MSSCKLASPTKAVKRHYQLKGIAQQRWGDVSSSPTKCQMIGFAEQVQTLCAKGELEKAANLLTYHTDQSPDFSAYLSFFKTCSKVKNVILIRRLYAHLAQYQQDYLTGLLGDHLAVSLAKCGAYDEAHSLFFSLSHRTAFSWTAVISGCVDCGRSREALQMYRSMLDDNVKPVEHTFACLMRACASISDLLEARKLHADAHQNGFASCIFVNTSLICTYGKCGSIVEAESVFCKLSERNVVTWNAMISANVDQRNSEKALKVYRQMQEEGVGLNSQTHVIILKALMIYVDSDNAVDAAGQALKKVSLEIAKGLHADAKRHGFMSDALFNSCLVRLYAKSGSMVDAENMFYGICQDNIIPYNAMMSAYLEHGQEEMVLHLYSQMQSREGTVNQQVLVSALQACGSLIQKNEFANAGGQVPGVMPLEIGKALHIDAKKHGFASDTFVGSTILNIYGRCGLIKEAEALFVEFSERNVVSWTVLLSAYAEHGYGEKAMKLYRQMRQESVSPSQKTFVVTLQACGMLVQNDKSLCLDGRHVMFLEIGQAIHADAKKQGFSSDIFIGNTLVTMYSRCGSILDARKVFDGLSKRDVVSYNAMISAYADHNQGALALQLYVQMQMENIDPNEQTLVSALNACSSLFGMRNEGGSNKVTSLKIGQALQFDASRKGITADNLFVGNTLLSMYGKWGRISEAEELFCRLIQRNIVSWNLMLTAYFEQGQSEQTLLLYRQMQQEHTSPNKQTLVITLQACGALIGREEPLVGQVCESKVAFFEVLQAVDADAQKGGFTSDIYVGSALVHAYSQCQSVTEAENVFDRLVEHDLVTWSAMLTAYLELGQGERSLQLYRQMQEEGVRPDQQTFVIVLQACLGLLGKEEECTAEKALSKSIILKMGRALHADLCGLGFASDLFVGSMLVSLYGRCGNIPEAEDVFNEISQSDVALWNAMISAYARQGQGEEALLLYKQMQEQRVPLDEGTLTFVLQSCSETGSLQVCNYAHFSIIYAGFDGNPLLATTLIRAYGSCGSMVNGLAIFDVLPRPDVTAWNACVAGHAQEANSISSFQRLEEMQSSGFPPNEASFFSLLSTCNHDSLIKYGTEYFEYMIRDHGIIPSLKHYTIMIDLLSRAGDFRRAESLLLGMPLQPDMMFWSCLLGSCAAHGNLELGKHVFSHAVNSMSGRASAFVLMSNIYAHAQLQEEFTVNQAQRLCMQEELCMNNIPLLSADE